MKVYIFLFLFWMMVGCQSGPSQMDAGSQQQKSSNIGDIRVAILGKQRKSNLVMVNQSNRRHLFPKEFSDLKNLTLSDLEYRAPFLSFHDNTSVTMIEDEVMEQLLSLFVQYRFGEYATSCNIEDFKNPRWPERDAIFLEQNGEMLVLVRDEKLVDQDKRVTRPGTAYRTLKYYVLQAQQAGYRPMQVMEGMDGKEFFKKEQKNAREDMQRIKENKK